MLTSRQQGGVGLASKRFRNFVGCALLATRCPARHGLWHFSHRLSLSPSTIAVVSQSAETAQLHAPPTLSRDEPPQPDGPQPGSGFEVSAAELQGLVQEAFYSRGAFSRDAETLAHQLQTDLLTGLGDSLLGPPDATLRTQLFGTNCLKDAAAVSFWDLVWEALQDRTLTLLIAAGAVSFALAALLPEAESTDWIEGIAILASVMIVVGVSAVTNYQKEAKFRVLNALKDDIQVRVVRGGVERPISTQELLVGDLLVVETGDILPADGILVVGEDLRLDESHMTGEAEEVIKSVNLSSQLMLAGAKVREGYGRVLVLAVGERSQQGVLAAMVLLGAGKGPAPAPSASSSSTTPPSATTSTDPLSSNGNGGITSQMQRPPPALAGPAAVAMATAEREETLLTRKLQGLADVIGNVGLGAAAFVFGVSSVTYTTSHLLVPMPVPMLEALQAYLGFFITGVTILVVAVPEGLPLAVTLALAFSVQRMLKDNNLVRHLDACETMASATTICSDKTGTLTANEMKVVAAWAGGQMYQTAAPTTTLAPPTTSPPTTPTPPPTASPPSPTSSLPTVPPGSNGSSRAAGSGSGWGGGGGGGGVPGQAQVPVLGAMMPVEAMPLQLLESLRQGVVFNCTASIRLDLLSGEVEKVGNRTECALLEWATQRSCDCSGPGGTPATPPQQQDDAVLLQSIPFTSERKRMSALVVLPEVVPRLKPRTSVPCRLLTKGGADVVLDRCSYQLSAEGTVIPLPESTKQQLLEPFTRQGLRVLALTYRDITLPSHVLSFANAGPEGKPVPAPGLQMPADSLESELVLVGLLGLQDPLRPDVTVAIQQCQRAGVTVRMLTGDNARTAACIASECGILPRGTDVDGALAASTRLVDDLMTRRDRWDRQGQQQLAAAAGGGAATPGQLGGGGGGGGLATAQRPAQGAAAGGPASSGGGQPPQPARLSPRFSALASDWDTEVPAGLGGTGVGAAVAARASWRGGRRCLSSLDDELSEEALYGPVASRSYDNNTNDAAYYAALDTPWNNTTASPRVVKAALPLVTSDAPPQGPLTSNQPQGVEGMAQGVEGMAQGVEGITSSQPQGVEGSPASALQKEAGNGQVSSTDANGNGDGLMPSKPQSLMSSMGQLEADINMYGSGNGVSVSGDTRWGSRSGSLDDANTTTTNNNNSNSNNTITNGVVTPSSSRTGEEVVEVVGSVLTSTTSTRSAGEASEWEAAAAAAMRQLRQEPDQAAPPAPQLGNGQPQQAAAYAATTSASVSSLAVPQGPVPSLSPVGKGPVPAPSATGQGPALSPPSATGQGAPPPADVLSAVMQRCEPISTPDHPLVMEGPQFRQLVQREDGSLDLAALRTIWPALRVLARCSPADKYLLVTGLKQLRQQADKEDTAQGVNSHLYEVIAMTGDGTNDAPALSAADVGFAMNSGTSIAKDAADIILLDNSFSSIVSAVKWGRNVYASVTKFLQFQLTANVVAVVTAGGGALLAAHSPLSAVQMLWVNLLMDSLASLALATEAPTDDLLDLPPVPPDQPLVTPIVAKHILGQAVVQLAVLSAMVLHGREWFAVDIGTQDTIIFNTFVCMQLFNQLNCRKVRDEADVTQGLFSHPTFCAIVGAEALLQVAIVQWGGAAFQTTPLTAKQWGVCVGLGATTLLVRAVLRQVRTEKLEAWLGKASKAVLQRGVAS